MYELLITDGMRKESKLFLIVMIFEAILAIVCPSVAYITNDGKYRSMDILLVCLLFVIFFLISLYGFLYSIKYKIEISKEKIVVSTLFRKFEVSVNKVIKYTCKRYGKSVFYQFRLYTNKDSVLVNTRYKDEFVKILELYKFSDR